MNISSHKILEKISDLVTKAKEAETIERQQGYVLAIKALCELLDQEESKKENFAVKKEVTPSVASSDNPLKQTVYLEDANGSSLLDF